MSCDYIYFTEQSIPHASDPRLTSSVDDDVQEFDRPQDLMWSFYLSVHISGEMYSFTGSNFADIMRSNTCPLRAQDVDSCFRHNTPISPNPNSTRSDHLDRVN